MSENTTPPKPEARTELTPEQKEVLEMFSEAMQIIMDLTFIEPEVDRDDLNDLIHRARKLARRFYRRLKITVR